MSKQAKHPEFLARGPFCWAKGESVEVAKLRLKREWPEQYAGRCTRKMLDNPKLVQVFMGRDLEIDDLGGVSGAKGTRRIQ